MKIFFSPDYSGPVYVRPADGQEALMDTLVANTIGLVNMLELRLGLHYDDVPEQQRLAHYYEAVCSYMAANPGNVMEASFKTTGLGTAKAMLAWRDELRSAQWDFKGAEISNRLSVLIGVEEHFRGHEGCDKAERLRIVTDQVKSQQLDCTDMVIRTALSKNMLF